MKELLKTSGYKITQIEFAAGTQMPRHSADHDAYLVVETGNALLIFKEEKFELETGSFLKIPANEQHILKVIKDFKAILILGIESSITYQGAA